MMAAPISNLTNERFELHGKVMGTKFHLVQIGGDPSLGDRLVRRLHFLESIWSRFLPTSEVSRLNKRPGDFHIVSPETSSLLQTAVDAWRLTDGAFDPTVLLAVEALGYDRTLVERQTLPRDSRPTSSPVSAPGCDGLVINLDTNLVCLGGGAGFDPGGIGKGLAADMVVREALDAGAAGIMVNIGGDLVCRGQAPTVDGWVVDVSEPTVMNGQVAMLAIAQGAVATSTTAKRRWATAVGERHHLVDPATGANTSGFKLVTVVAGAGWYAEAVAKQLMVTGDPSVIDTGRASALIIDDDGHLHCVGPIEGYRR